ncbi:MAG: peptide deformylase [Endomicrobiales bacterium]|nr:peptide deformylase [Endomicrobiales bacterium]
MKIVTYPKSVLRKRCYRLQAVGDADRRIMDRMAEAMKTNNGVGLAAPQVGIPLQIIVLNPGDGVVKLANPEIVEHDGFERMEEGCLSLPGIRVDVERYYEVVVRGLNESGKRVELKAQGLASRILQHEIDHLNGRLILDRLPLLKRARYYIDRKLGIHADI